MMGDEVRSKFLSKITSIYKGKANTTYIISKYDYVQRLKRLIELNDGHTQKTAADQRLLKNFCIVNETVNNVTTRNLCRPGTSLKYVPVEELYETLLGIHVQLNHAGRNCMQRHIRTRYCNISKDCVMIFLQTCQDCPRQKRMNGVTKRNSDRLPANGEEHTANTINESLESPHTAGGNASVISTAPLRISNKVSSADSFSRGQFDLFEMQKSPDGKYNWFLRYTNLATHEIRLRPIATGTVCEIADVLVDIYCEQGAPSVLQSLNGRKFVEQVIKEVAKIYPQCRQLHGEIPNGGTDCEPNVILSQLAQLMKRFNTDSWSSLLRFLQFEINTSYRDDIQTTPFEVTFKKPASMGLRSSKLMDAIYEKTQSEEEIMEYLADAELIRMSVFCQQTTSEPKRAIIRPCYDESIPFATQTYSPLPLNGAPSSNNNIVSHNQIAAPDSMPHSATPSSSFYAQPPAGPPIPNNFLPASQTPTQQLNGPVSAPFQTTTFEHPVEPTEFYSSVSSTSTPPNESTMVQTMKTDDSIMTTQMDQCIPNPHNCQ